MAFKRKYKGRRKSKRFTRKSRKTNVARIVRKVIASKAETKFGIVSVTESSVNSFSSPASTNSILLNNPGVGSNVYQRTGNKIRARRIDIRGHVELGDGNKAHYVKILVLKCNINDDPITDLLESQSAVFSAASADVAAIYSRVNTSKYRVLASKVLTVGTGSGFLTTKLFRFNINLKDMEIRWDQGASTPEQHIRIIYFARQCANDEGAVASTLEMTWNSKMYYHDY